MVTDIDGVDRRLAVKLFATVFLLSALFFKPQLDFSRFEFLTNSLNLTNGQNIVEMALVLISVLLLMVDQRTNRPRLTLEDRLVRYRPPHHRRGHGPVCRGLVRHAADLQGAADRIALAPIDRRRRAALSAAGHSNP